MVGSENDMSTIQTLKKQIRKNPLPWVMQSIGLLVVIANLFIASLLAPVVQDIHELDFRVQAIEKHEIRRDELNERFYILEEKVKGIDKKLDVMDSKIDRLMMR